MLDAWCVITNKVVLSRSFFAARSSLRLVCVVATGLNNVDLDAAEEYGVSVMNCQGYSTATVAQHTMMMILMLLRNFNQYQRDIDHGKWSRSPQFCLLDHPIRETSGLTLGIVCFGEIGKKVFRLARAFDFNILVAERQYQVPRDGRTAFEEVLKRCDVLTLHCPLTEQTRQMINQDAFESMRPGSILINTARGELIDEQALLKALKNDLLAGAGLDVLTEEPPDEHNALLQIDHPNLIITPHNAWGSKTARQYAIDQTCSNIKRWLQENI